MRRFLPIHSGIFLALAVVFLAPAQASAAGWSGTANWLSQLFSWQAPTVSHFSNLFEARKDNVEDNSFERIQLLERRHATASGTVDNFTASSSPVSIPADLFEEKRVAIVAELTSAVNALKTSRAELSDFIGRQAAEGDDISVAQSALADADADIGGAVDAVAVLANYEPIPDSSGLVDLTEAQSDLSAAVAAIQTARDSLKSAIAAAGDSVQ